MKRISLLLGFTLMGVSLSNQTMAALAGAYVGIGAGYSILHTPKNAFVPKPTHTRGGLGGRVHLGLNFNTYLGLEAGFAHYARSHYRGSTNTQNASLNYHSKAFDIVGKGYLPLKGGHFNLYGLAGAVRVAQTITYDNNTVPLNAQIVTPITGTTHVNTTRPMYGAGISYDISRNLRTNLEYSQVRRIGRFNQNQGAIPDMDMLTLNLSYKFS